MIDGDKALQVRISGRVQGVSFRDWTLREATARGLVGWVRNEPDGTVSALIKGAPHEVDAMVERFWDGPRAASVSDVISEEVDGADAPSPFRVTG